MPPGSPGLIEPWRRSSSVYTRLQLGGGRKKTSFNPDKPLTPAWWACGGGRSVSPPSSEFLPKWTES